MVLRRALSTTFALVLALGLAGCGTAPPSSTPTPVAPGPVLTPAPSPDMEALYAEAERVVREAAELEKAYFMDADNTHYPEELTEFYEDPYRESHQELVLGMKARGMHSSPDSVVRWGFQPAPEEVVLDAEVAMWVCQDSTAAPAVDEFGEVIDEGRASVMLYYFKHFDGQLKLYAAHSYKEVETCAE